jgi:hypothetical protein
MDLAFAHDAMTGPDEQDPVCTKRVDEPVKPQLATGIARLRIAVAGGYFRAGASEAALGAVDGVARAVGAVREMELREAARARAAAYVITTSEGAALHLQRLRTRASDFDPTCAID